MYSCTGLEASYENLNCQQHNAHYEGSRGEGIPCLFPSLWYHQHPWHSQACGRITLVSTSAVTWHSPCVSIALPFL